MRKDLYIGDTQLFGNIANVIRLVDATEEREAILLLGFYHTKECYTILREHGDNKKMSVWDGMRAPEPDGFIKPKFAPRPSING